MMKKIVILLAAAALTTACGSNQAGDATAGTDVSPVDSVVKARTEKKAQKAVRSAPTPLSEQAVEAQLRSCYAEVNRMAAAGDIDVDRLDRKYCSTDFRDLKDKLGKKVQKGEVRFDGDEGYHWTAGIAVPLTVDSVRALLVTAEQAQAELWLTDDGGNKGYLEVTLYFEDGMWKFHDWIDDEVYPYGALFSWMQSLYDGETDAEETEEETPAEDGEN